MIKKISIDQLKPGMYIHDLNCGWMAHPFVTGRFNVKSESVIQKIVEYGIHHVYIDTEKGLDVDNAPTAEEVGREIQTELDRIADLNDQQETETPLFVELEQARQIKKDAKKTVHMIMEDVRLGIPIKTEEAERVVDTMIESIFRNRNALIILGRIKQTDEYTYLHSMSVCVLMISFGRNLGFTPVQLREAGVGALLHDIGKMKVPRDILSSRTKLTNSQYDIMKKHVEYSRFMLSEADGISSLSLTLAAEHHERINGMGYPGGLRGDEISLYGQAAAIVDVYDAMTSQRCYQQRFEPTEVLKKLYEWSDSYNTSLVQQFIRCVGIYPVGTLVRLDSGLLGIVLAHGRNNLLQPLVRVIYDSRRSRHVTPYHLDLEQIREERVAGYEVPEKWGLTP
ncbi:MAG: HD-GYP domain-containing protein, partial [Nitrospiraceae bacterium]